MRLSLFNKSPLSLYTGHFCRTLDFENSHFLHLHTCQIFIDINYAVSINLPL
eukprot:c19195_g1_i1 orf=838-993(-)